MLLTHKRQTPRDPTKFPTAQLFLLALVRVAEPIALTSIFPYAWKLVLDFHLGDKDNASFYAGILISAFAFAESLTGMYWGGLSDRLGRKPVLVMGCLGTIASLLIVGFSTNFWIALFGRFLGGALNGNIGVIQTMVGELVVNPKHEPKAYAVMPFVWSVGTIIGPAIGGYFALPAETFPRYFAKHGLFAKFPYLLPNLICVGLMSVSIIAGWLCLEETHPDKQGEDCQNTPAATSIPSARRTSATSVASLVQENYGTFNAVEETIEDEEWKVNADGTSRTSSFSGASTQKLFTKRVIMLTIALGIFTYHSMTYDHLLPIFLQDNRILPENIMAIHSGPLSGGLGLSTQQTGVIMSVNGIIALVVQAIIFPLFASWLGIWKTFMLVTIGHPVAYLIIPWLVLLPDYWTYPGIYACLTIRNIFSILAYPLLLILIKEASPAPGCLGKINGLAASTGAACRTAASPVAGLLFGVGTKAGFTPLPWLASALVAAIGTVQAFFIHRQSKRSQHEVHAAPPFRITPPKPRRESVVRISVRDLDSGYHSDDERRPLIPGRSEGV